MKDYQMMKTNNADNNRSRSFYDLVHSFLRIVFAINIILAIFQAVTVLQQRIFLQELEIETWLIIYLLVIGLIKLSFHGLAFISFGKRLREIRLWFAWLAFITNVTSYWLEYFFLWHEDQRFQMPLFTLGTQVLGFALLAYYTIQKQKWEPFDGS